MIAHPPPLLKYVTSDDIVRAGACAGGVRAIHKRMIPLPTVAEVDGLLSMLPEENARYVSIAAGYSGSGYGSGYGSGDSSGYGYGSGYGDE